MTGDLRELRAMVRRLPLSRRDAEQRLIVIVSLCLAVTAHAAFGAVVVSLPETEYVTPVNGLATPLEVAVVIVEKEEREEPPPPPVVIEEPPPPVEVVELAEIKPAEIEPPRVESPPKAEPKVAKVVRKRRIRKGKRKPRAARPAAPAARPVAKAITSPSAEAEGGGEPAAPTGPVADGSADAAPGEPAGDPAGDPKATSQTGTPDGEVDVPDVDLAALRRGYITRVTRAVHRRYRMPRAAARAGLEGRVLIELIIDGTGAIVSKRVLKSSGHNVLDKAALAAVGSVGKLPQPPTELHWSRQSIQVPFVYRLRPRT